MGLPTGELAILLDKQIPQVISLPFKQYSSSSGRTAVFVLLGLNPRNSQREDNRHRHGKWGVRCHTLSKNKDNIQKSYVPRGASRDPPNHLTCSQLTGKHSKDCRSSDLSLYSQLLWRLKQEHSKVLGLSAVPETEGEEEKQQDRYQNLKEHTFKQVTEEPPKPDGFPSLYPNHSLLTAENPSVSSLNMKDSARTGRCLSTAVR